MENRLKVGIQAIAQKDAHHFEILWTDGHITHYQLAELQRECPCAGCVDELSGKRLTDAKSISDTLSAVKLKSVGRYAIQIEFSQGCSKGIYGYNFLRTVKGLPF